MIQNSMGDTKYFHQSHAIQGNRVFPHLNLHSRWIEPARDNGINIEIISFLPVRHYIIHRAELRQKKESYCRVVPVIGLPYVSTLSAVLYLLTIALRYETIVVQTRKGATRPFDVLMKLFPEKVKYVKHFEGDIVAETEYLLENPYKEGFYDRNLEDWRQKQRRELEKADHISVSTDAIYEILLERYPELNLEGSISVFPELPPNDFHYSADRRREMRRELGVNDQFVMTYMGNAYYSWQKASLTIEVVDRLVEDSYLNVHLTFLVPERDHDIIQSFLNETGISADDYSLLEIDHHEVNDYLLASDLGVVLRDHHPMNAAAIPGKLLEYLASGLPVLTTTAVPLGDELKEQGFGIIFDDIPAADEIAEAIMAFEAVNVDRCAIAEWITQELNVDNYIDEYVAMFEAMEEG